MAAEEEQGSGEAAPAPAAAPPPAGPPAAADAPAEAAAAAPADGPAAAPAAAAPAAAAPAAAAPAAAEARKRKREAKGAAEAGAKAAKKEAPCLVVFGLGSQGEEHAQQRHNLGARVVAALAGRLGAVEVPDCEGAAGVRRLEGPGRPKLFLPPQGEINSSGRALQAALAALSQPEAAFLLVVDDCSLPLGTIRFRAKGSSGGHNGLKSVEAIYGLEYHRLKLGIGGERSKEHVVGAFAAGVEAETANLAAEQAAKAAELWLKLGPEGVQKVMATVNAPDFCRVSLPSPPAPAAPALVAAAAAAEGPAGAEGPAAVKCPS